jgi:BirA family transcriptional regulator, biotin operon repressor / biotin---[acetyl-CoA-carboxylase] ligase
MDIPGVEVRLVERCDSTNSVLLAERAGADHPVLLVAAQQSAGRGQRGRRWHSTPDAGLTFSLALRVRRPLRELAGLSLVAGVAAARALRALGAARAALKWPNDLLVDGAKLGGILVETRASGSAAPCAVIGIGINLRGGDALSARLRRPVASLDQFVDVSAAHLLRNIVSSLLAAIHAFETGGLDAVRGDWEALHAHAGQRLRVRLADGRSLSGIAAGLDRDGGLRLRTRAGLRAVRSGRVVRARAA